jgi:hypothetical protein
LVVELFCQQLTRAQIARPSDSPFDHPLREVVVDLGLSEFYEPRRNVHNTLACYYYPKFLVKQLDFREKGAEWVGIVPVRGDKEPACAQSKDDGELRVDQNDWDGYFSGVVGEMVFLDAADGMNGSMRFRIVDATSGRTVFEDEAKRKYRIRNNTLAWEGQRLQIETRADGPPVLSYNRGYFADCPLPKGGTACWNKIRAATGLQQASAPVCTGVFKEDPDDPVVIFYRVRLELAAKPVLTLAPGPVRCEAQD